MKNQFKVWQPVVYTRADGSSQSATITQVNENAVVVSWPVGPGKACSEIVPRAAWANITPFGNSLFLAL